MIKKIVSWFRPASDARKLVRYPDGKRIYREFHALRRDSMDQDALKVINRLGRHGHRSYLVGGCVRDMLLGKRPKDFDVVTSATPQQIRKLFSNSRAVGRRFKIVHILFKGGKVIEVSTFRSVPVHRLEGGSSNKDVFLKRDNEFGSPMEDAARRDFTMNALFFDPRNESLIDYVGGFEDIQNKEIHVIGDPDVSFREDPVRMLRAAKFAALLGFEMSSSCQKAIKKNKSEILKANSNRLLEEFSKIFRTGRAAEILDSMYETGLLKEMIPQAVDVSDRIAGSKMPFAETPIGRRITIADRMLTEREELTTTIYFALFFCDLVQDVFSGQKWNRSQHIAEYVKEGIYPICKQMQIATKDRDRLLEMFISQTRFMHSSGRKKDKPDVFRKKIFFYEAFMLFKIYALSVENEEAVQKAMFWEIGPRERPPEISKIVSVFPIRGKRAPGGGRNDKFDKFSDKPSKKQKRNEEPEKNEQEESTGNSEETDASDDESSARSKSRRKGRRRPGSRKKGSGQKTKQNKETVAESPGQDA